MISFFLVSCVVDGDDVPVLDRHGRLDLFLKPRSRRRVVREIRRQHLQGNDTPHPRSWPVGCGNSVGVVGTGFGFGR